MKSDKLFYEYFQVAPYALFELLQITPGCAYRFESPVIKAIERRLDGILEPEVLGHPRYFIEVQGYHDKGIYWRTLHEISGYHTQHPEIHGQPWQAVILFLDKAYDPGVGQLGTLSDNPMPWLVSHVLPELLKQVTNPSPVLNVLQPLITLDEEEVRQNVNSWVREIRQSAELSRDIQERLSALLIQFIVEKFSRLNYWEIEKMLQLTPLEETVTGRQLMQMGQVRLLAALISRRFFVPTAEVIDLLDPLGPLGLLELEDVEALGEYLLKAETYEQIETWIEARTTKEVSNR